MWRRPTGSERDYLIAKCTEFMSDTSRFRAAMFRAVLEWKVSSEVNLTNPHCNQQAWVGHAACCIAIDCPEEPTRAAWWNLTQQQRDDADLAALEAIEFWQSKYMGEYPKCPSTQLELTS